MLFKAAAARLQAGVARNQVRALAGQLGDDVLIEQRVADLDDAEDHDQQQRQDHRELDDALPGVADVEVLIGTSLSFFIADWTRECAARRW